MINLDHDQTVLRIKQRASSSAAILRCSLTHPCKLQEGTFGLIAWVGAFFDRDQSRRSVTSGFDPVSALGQKQPPLRRLKNR